MDVEHSHRVFGWNTEHCLYFQIELVAIELFLGLDLMLVRWLVSWINDVFDEFSQIWLVTLSQRTYLHFTFSQKMAINFQVGVILLFVLFLGTHTWFKLRLVRYLINLHTWLTLLRLPQIILNLILRQVSVMLKYYNHLILATSRHHLIIIQQNLVDDSTLERYFLHCRLRGYKLSQRLP